MQPKQKIVYLVNHILGAPTLSAFNSLHFLKQVNRSDANCLKTWDIFLATCHIKITPKITVVTLFFACNSSSYTQFIAMASAISHYVTPENKNKTII